MFSLSTAGGGPYPLADLDRGVQIRWDTGNRGGLSPMHWEK